MTAKRDGRAVCNARVLGDDNSRRSTVHSDGLRLLERVRAAILPALSD